MTVSNKDYKAWLKEVTPDLKRHVEHVPSPAKPSDYVLCLYEWPRPGEIHFRGSIEVNGQAKPIEVEVAPGATVAFEEITLKLN